MTFSELQTEIMDRMNLSSTDAQTRVGRAINRVYRKVTTAIGLQLSRRMSVQETVTPGVSTVVFSSTEKIISIQDRTTTPYRTLQEVTIEELETELPFSESDAPTKYAIYAHSADTVTILINREPQTAFSLYADVHSSVGDLSGSGTPAFPESFHDVIIEGVLADELRKMEKPQLASLAKTEYEHILSDLRMWIAKSNALDIYQGKTSNQPIRGTSGAGSSSGSVDGTTSYTQTGNINFDRDPSAPFTVTASSAKVTNLDADKIDGLEGADLVRKTASGTITAQHTFDNDPLAPFIVTASSAVVTNLDADKLDGQHGAYYIALSANALKATYTPKIAGYNAVANDLVVATANSFTVTLPAAASNTNGFVMVVNNGTGTITIGRTGSDTIGLATSQTLNPATASSQGDGFIFISDGISNWIIL